MPNTLVPIIHSTSGQRNRSFSASFAAILAIYAFTRILQILPATTPSTSIVALEIFSTLVFALIHGALHYRLRGILVFAAISLAIGNVMETIGVQTGFPYGHYEFLPLMGPQLNRVPILLGLAYLGMAYVSWTLARLILGATTARLERYQLTTVPLLAAFIMTAWDLAQDPVWSTLLHGWRWRDGGAWFGVPLTNYAGWLLTVFLIYFVFALYLGRRGAFAPEPASPHWRTAIVLYTFCALGNVLQLLRPQPLEIVTDPTGTQWHTAAILRASAFVSVFIMGSFAFSAWVRIPGLGTNATD
jgi:uncharacterized membrane protein